MHSIETVEAIFKRYGKVMRRYELMREKIHACTLRRLEQEGYIQKFRAGYYEWVADEGPDELGLVCRIFPEAIICMESALYIYQYTDRVPRWWHLAAPQHASRGKYRQPYPYVRPYFRVPESLELGKIRMEYNGRIVQTYDRERVICDCIAYRRRMDREIYNKAIRNYFEDSSRDISRLMQYADKMHIAQVVQDIASIWH